MNKLKFSRTPPYAFTEHGVIMAASVLNSPRAVEVSVLVVRAFVKLREMLFTHKELAKKFAELESRLANHDVAIQQLLYAIRKLMDEPPAPPKPRIGFRSRLYSMPTIQAFRGLRYDLGHVGSLSDVVTPPYDVISPEFQDELYKKHPANFIRLELNRDEPGDNEQSNKYARAASS